MSLHMTIGHQTPPSIVDTFEAAGIVYPRDLAKLEVCHYPALGVKEAADHKKYSI
jgi:hypothetical protein